METFYGRSSLCCFVTICIRESLLLSRYWPKLTIVALNESHSPFTAREIDLIKKLITIDHFVECQHLSGFDI